MKIGDQTQSEDVEPESDISEPELAVDPKIEFYLTEARTLVEMLQGNKMTAKAATHLNFFIENHYEMIADEKIEHVKEVYGRTRKFLVKLASRRSHHLEQFNDEILQIIQQLDYVMSLLDIDDQPQSAQVGEQFKEFEERSASRSKMDQYEFEPERDTGKYLFNEGNDVTAATSKKKNKKKRKRKQK